MLKYATGGHEIGEVLHMKVYSPILLFVRVLLCTAFIWGFGVVAIAEELPKETYEKLTAALVIKPKTKRKMLAQTEVLLKYFPDHLQSGRMGESDLVIKTGHTIDLILDNFISNESLRTVETANAIAMLLLKYDAALKEARKIGFKPLKTTINVPPPKGSSGITGGTPDLIKDAATREANKAVIQTNEANLEINQLQRVIQFRLAHSPYLISGFLGALGQNEKLLDQETRKKLEANTK
jgi:hypothetical protein